MNVPGANQGESALRRGKYVALGAWLLFFATFPAGMVVGWLMAQGQDAAGRGIGIGLGMLGVGLLGGIAMGVLVSYATARVMSSFAGKLLACLPWVMLVGFWAMVPFTESGDRLFEWLENI